MKSFTLMLFVLFYLFINLLKMKMLRLQQLSLENEGNNVYQMLYCPIFNPFQPKLKKWKYILVIYDNEAICF